MAVATLPVLSHPDFPQVFTSAIAQLVEQAEMVRCYFSDEHTPTCKRLATVHYLPNGQEFCSDHFKVVSRG
jgi:hypothetical protein